MWCGIIRFGSRISRVCSLGCRVHGLLFWVQLMVSELGLEFRFEPYTLLACLWRASKVLGFPASSLLYRSTSVCYSMSYGWLWSKPLYSTLIVVPYVIPCITP